MFESKANLLRELWHLLLRGEEDGLPVGDQDWHREVLEEPDPALQLWLNMRNSRVVKLRAGRLLEVIRGAATGDPDIAELWERIQREFYANQRAVVQSIADKGALRVDVEEAADILWTLNHPSFYALLAGERGWSAERYEEWVGNVLVAQLIR